MSVLLVPRNLFVSFDVFDRLAVEEVLCLHWGLPFDVFTICIAFDPVRIYAILLFFFVLLCYVAMYSYVLWIRCCVGWLAAPFANCFSYVGVVVCVLLSSVLRGESNPGWGIRFALIRKGYAHWQRYTCSKRLDSYLTAQGAKKKSSFG